MARISVLAVFLSALWSVDAFVGAPMLRSRGLRTSLTVATPMRMAGLKEDDFIPSEEWLGEYMGQQGLRYALNKTPQEVATEGDYTIFEKLFGQTSNNKARMDLKKVVLEKVKKPDNPEMFSKWLTKYGYGRYFPAYVDKSGGDSGDVATPAAVAVATPAPKPQSGGVKLPSFSLGGAPKAAAPKPAPKAAPTAAPRAKVTAKAAPRAKAAPKAAPKPVRKPVAKKPVAAKPAPPGNIANIPKAL